MRTLALAAVACALASPLAAQATGGRPTTPPGRAGLLIGWVGDGENVPAGDTVQRGALHTVWIYLSNGSVATRSLPHIVVPRATGFWQVGLHTDSADRRSDSSTVVASMQETSIWAAPIGKTATFKTLDSTDVQCVDMTTDRDLTYVGPNYVGYVESGSSMCAHYDESHSLAVVGLDDVYAGNATDRSVEIGALGANAVALHQRLNRVAARWPNDLCDTAPGFFGEPTDWTIRRARGQWEVVAMFAGSGGTFCGRNTVERRLRVVPRRSIVTPEHVLSASWTSIDRAFPGAIDATASPNGVLLVVLRRRPDDGAVEAIVASVKHGELRAVSTPILLGRGRPVLLEWATDARASQWNDFLSALPR
jgi:hypothetical protein